ncbi:hypothetical protein LTR27_009666 [Elasticomyces elasticus]|nr:hypothetical protein LTR27_009666 [Elasticomyces elasticus]
MVAVDLLAGLDVCIKVNGQALAEYEDRDEEAEDRTIVRYVEAVSGQVFSIQATARAGFRSAGDAVSFRIHVDGSECVDAPMISNDRSRFMTSSAVSTGLRSGENRVSLYQFAPLQTISEASHAASGPTKAQDIGSIVIRLHLKKVIGTGKRIDDAFSGRNVGTVSEKLLKGQAVSHSVAYTAPVVSTVRSTMCTEPVTGVPAPYTTLVFRYRSLETLKSMLIIPRTPSPPPLEERSIESMSRDELQELQRQLRELREQATSQAEVKREIKRERTDDNPRPRKVARPNRASTVLEFDDDNSVRESSTATFAPGPEVVDLTDD